MDDPSGFVGRRKAYLALLEAAFYLSLGAAGITGFEQTQGVVFVRLEKQEGRRQRTPTRGGLEIELEEYGAPKFQKRRKSLVTQATGEKANSAMLQQLTHPLKQWAPPNSKGHAARSETIDPLDQRSAVLRESLTAGVGFHNV
jgi:hypothetical protein